MMKSKETEDELFPSDHYGLLSDLMLNPFDSTMETSTQQTQQHTDIKIDIDDSKLNALPDIDIPTFLVKNNALEIGRAVQQECRDRSRMPSSA
eukprot:TRINITY_DN93672_c0_g1_i1.p1 TRINITY_DN93672_c0_g1~~TRINITY_DN93672_c0_g1_i1.p1  ORF type:complete len:102 (+),score=20.96 TRINITY_DN93672_c0_g1_i1:30-308(+)